LRELHLLRPLGVDDPGLRIAEQTAGELHRLGVGVAGRGQVGQAVGDGDAVDVEGAAELPGAGQPAGNAEIAEDRPGLVDNSSRRMPSRPPRCMGGSGLNGMLNPWPKGMLKRLATVPL
jgi:hypothetical protein